MLWTIAEFGSLFFWMFFVIFPLIVMLCVVDGIESNTLATVVVVFWFLVVQLFTSFNVVHWIGDNIQLVVWCLIGYFIAGALYSTLKWYFFCIDSRTQFRERRAEYLLNYNKQKTSNDAQVSAPIFMTFEAWCNSYRDYPPLASKNKSRLIMWMTYWPFSALWTLVHRPFQWLYDLLSNVYDRIAASVFKGEFQQ